MFLEVKECKSDYEIYSHKHRKGLDFEKTSVYVIKTF